MLDEYPKPVIAAVDGPAYGAGLNMVCLSDLILATPEARFCFPMTRLGIIPGYAGAARLALFGVAWASATCPDGTSSTGDVNGCTGHGAG